jgi:hypothetical protein
MWVQLVFHVSCGRDNNTVPSLISARCTLCPAGTHHPGCSHIMTDIHAMSMLQGGSIVAGDIGDGPKAWGDDHKKASHVATQPINKIALLTPTGHLTKFTGILVSAPPLEARMSLYIERKRVRALPTQSIVELQWAAKEKAAAKRIL